MQVIKTKQNHQWHNQVSFYTPSDYSEHCLVYLGNDVASVQKDMFFLWLCLDLKEKHTLCATKP